MMSRRAQPGFSSCILPTAAADSCAVPQSIDERMTMFGYCNELCGEHGFSWSKRLLLLHPALSTPNADPKAWGFRNSWETSTAITPEAEAAPVRCAEILRTLTARLEQQRARKPLLWQPTLSVGYLLGGIRSVVSLCRTSNVHADGVSQSYQNRPEQRQRIRCSSSTAILSINNI
jgi:hypothetical protein